MRVLRSGCLADGQRDRAKAFDLTLDAVSRLQGADALRRTGVDQIAWRQVIKLGEIGNDLRDAPDQCLEVGCLFGFPVDRQGDSAASDVANQVSTVKLAND